MKKRFTEDNSKKTNFFVDFIYAVASWVNLGRRVYRAALIFEGVS